MFKPMHACSTIPLVTDIKYPAIASRKLDGIRCLMINQLPVSRTLKPIPNKHITNVLSKLYISGLDGELTLTDPTKDFNDCQSAFMSEQGMPDFTYHVFDCFMRINKPFKERLAEAAEIVQALNHPRVVMVPHERIEDAVRMQERFEAELEAGQEGLIVRNPIGRYKFGRSTMKEGLSLKLKLFEDAEGTIIGWEELVRQDGVPAGTLGALLVELPNKITVKVGTGYTAYQRSELWAKKQSLLGSLLTYKHQGLSSYGVPRFPVFKGLRSHLDV